MTRVDPRLALRSLAAVPALSVPTNGAERPIYDKYQELKWNWKETR